MQSYTFALLFSLVVLQGLATGGSNRMQHAVQERVDSGFSFNPEHQLPITAKRGEVEVATQYRNEQLYLNIKRGNPVTKSYPLPIDMAQASQVIFSPSNKVTVIGMYSGDISEVAIFNLTTMTVTDHFLCYSPAPSPNGRYIAFTRFYPPHAEDAEDQYMVYDSEISSSRNRPYASAPDDRTDVGLPVFPLFEHMTPRNNLMVSSTEAHFMAASTFFWTDDSRSFLFADHFHQSISLVFVKLVEGDHTSVATIPTEQLGVCQGRPKAQDPCWVRLTSVKFGGPAISSHILLQFQGFASSVGYEKTVFVADSDFHFVNSM